MTTATATARRWALDWNASVADSPLGHLELVWGEIGNRHPSTRVLEDDILSDTFYEALYDRTLDAFRAGFASAALVDRLGYPPDVDNETLLQAIVKEARVAQVPGHIEGRDFVPEPE